MSWIIDNIGYIPQDQRSKLKAELQNDDMLANLTFGTWIHILNKHYRLFSDADLSYIFGLSRKQINTQFNKLCNELKIIKNYRNRIFHYEKVNNHHQYHNIEHLIDKFIKLLDIDNILEDSVRKLKINNA